MANVRASCISYPYIMKMFLLSNSKIPVEPTADPCYSAEISSRPIRRHNPPERNRNGKLKQFFPFGLFGKQRRLRQLSILPIPPANQFLPCQGIETTKVGGGRRKCLCSTLFPLKEEGGKRENPSGHAFPLPTLFLFLLWDLVPGRRRMVRR